MEFITLSDIVKRAFEVTFIISIPFLAASLISGLIISFLQTLTNIQETTLAFVPKIIIVLILGLILGSFVTTEFLDFTKEIINSIPSLVK
ncbi:MAG: flagellar biosynthetic protein FliQ [Candidatus Calescibacterium sp.]|jgi:flagellar biosynthetic protein FliQ|nr:flagellar biosynthetic protein FliQ [Candidatus Calescibacterium sp.]